MVIVNIATNVMNSIHFSAWYMAISNRDKVMVLSMFLSNGLAKSPNKI